MTFIKKHAALSIAICLTAMLISILLGCESSKPVDQGVTGEEQTASVGGEASDDEHLSEYQTVDQEPGQIEDTTDYSQMSREEIIYAFMKAWEEQNTAVMDELALFYDYGSFFPVFYDYGYDDLFCDGRITPNEQIVCPHDLNDYNHTVYDLEIRQADARDYGWNPDENKTAENMFCVTFYVDVNNITIHLNKCSFLYDQEPDDSGRYMISRYFRTGSDKKERGHWVIKEIKHNP